MARTRKIYNAHLLELLKTPNANRDFLTNILFYAIRGQAYFNASKRYKKSEKEKLVRESNNAVESINVRLKGKNVSVSTLEGMMLFVNSILIREGFRVRDIGRIEEIPSNQLIQSLATKHAVYHTTN